MKYKFHIPTQQYGFLEVTGDNLSKLEGVYNRYAETPLNFSKGKFVEVKTFTDEVIRYNDLTHQYTDVDGNTLVSASQYAKSIKPPFDKEKILPLVSKKYNVPTNTIDEMWSANGKISRTLGDAIHFSMEQWFTHKKHGCDEKEYHLPKHPFLREVVTSFPDKDKDITPEVVVSDVKNKMVGRLDGLYKTTIIDYKSDAKIKDNLKYHFKQLSFYATILNNKGYKVDNLVVFNYTDKWTKYEDKPITIKL